MNFSTLQANFPRIANIPRILTAGRDHELPRIRFPRTLVNLLLAVLAARDTSKDIVARFMVWLPGGTEDLRPDLVELVVDVFLDEDVAERGPLVAAPKI